ncbi:MAG TPA: glycosyltransferase family 87 protein, partial [Polyangiales bacterium]|nr:glycosyltransferase family 87 protein [Polyangiales bacterium]
MTRDIKLKAVFAYLVVSSASVRSLPFSKPWGTDLHNIHIYQLCSGDHDPYLIPGVVCGDIFHRGLVYPPLLFHAFFWLRHFVLESAMELWTSLTLLMLLGTYWLWLRMSRRYCAAIPRWEIAIFCGLLIPQFPLAFALERGGTDIVPLLLWSLASYAICRRWIAVAGLIAGVATAFKLYPVFPTVLVTFALLASAFRSRAFKPLDFLRFSGCAFSAFIGANLLFLRDAISYFNIELPRFAATYIPLVTSMHSIVSFGGADHTWYPKLVLALFFALYCWSASRSIAARPALMLAAALAISTYFAATSWDYNLITVYPLLVLLFIEARRTDRWLGLVLGLVSIVGDRESLSAALAPLFSPAIHLALQFAFLLEVAIELVQLSSEGSPAIDAAARSNEPS